MVGDQHADAARRQVPDQPPDVRDGQRIDPRERLVEQDVFRLGREAAGDLDPPTLAAGEGDGRRAPQMGDRELAEQLV